MMGESLAGGLGDRLEKREVIRRGRDGDMAHGGCEDRELGLDIDSSAVPAQERMDSMGMPQIMNAGDTPFGRVDIGAVEEALQTPTEAHSRVGPQSSMAVHEKRRGCSVRQTPANSQVHIHLASGIVGEGNEARLVELR